MTTEQTKSEGRIIKVAKGDKDKGIKGGFGFIISPQHPYTKFFFHWTGLIQSTKKFMELEEGMKVKFIPLLESSDKEKNRGPRAIQIEVIQ